MFTCTFTEKTNKTNLLGSCLLSKRVAFNVLKICLFLALLLPFSISAQKTTGLLEDDEGYARQPVMPHYSGSKDQVPSKISLKTYCPAPRNQGEAQSCVGWSIGYGALTIERAIQNGWTDTRKITEGAFSALFIYNQIKSKGSCDKALSKMPDAMNLLMEKGNCLAKEFDINVNDCQKKPTLELLKTAQLYRLKDFVPIFKSDENTDNKVQIFKAILAKKKPVVISLRINNQLKSLKDKKIWYPDAGDKPLDSHALTLIGYDDETGLFEILNSWGTDWSDKGFFKIKYYDLAQYCSYAYVLYLNKGNTSSDITIGEKPNTSYPEVKPPISKDKPVLSSKEPKKPNITDTPSVKPPLPTDKPVVSSKNVDEKPTSTALVELAGQFIVKEYKGLINGENRFEPTPVERIDNHYVLKRSDWKKGDMYQLDLTSEFSETYMYIINLNPKNEAQVLFPRNQDYNEKYKGWHETPLIMLDGARIVLPDLNHALQIREVGTDRLCVLFSLKKITNLKDLCNLLKGSGNNFEKRVHELLGSHMIPLADTGFKEETVAFSVSTRTNGSIVPIFIEFQSK
jgi:hypothetical protein